MLAHDNANYLAQVDKFKIISINNNNKNRENSTALDYLFYVYSCIDNMPLLCV